jgi:hypothetical protein
MFDDLDYRHTAAIKRDAWFLKLWCWAWEMEPESADFCKLFWGYIFLPLNFLVRIVAWPVIRIVHGLKAVFKKIGSIGDGNLAMTTLEESRAQRDLEALKDEESEEKKKRREERIAKFFGVVGSIADRVVSFFQSTWKVTKFVFYAIIAAVMLVLAGVIVWGIVELVELIGTDVSGVLHVTLIVLAIIVSITLFVAIFTAILWTLVETPVGRALKRFFKRVFGAFGSSMYTGLVAIKTRTCPKIELVDPDENPQAASDA